MTSSNAAIFAALLLLFPLLGSVVNAICQLRYGRRLVNLVGTLSIGASFIVALVVLAVVHGASWDHQSTTSTLWTWLDLGPGNLHASVDITIDPLSTLMVLVITGVGFLIHVYSVDYMEGDPDIARFFSYMNFFVFSMLLLVLAANFIVLIVGWALVALSSYLLIGYYYQRPSAVLAARKAFITQVIGDVALVIAAFLIVTHVMDGGGHSLFTLSLPDIFANATYSFAPGGAVITGICVLLAVAAFAKSAQFPLHTWLPDAMEGPTPVSALIHAATMVTAGVYLIARFHTLFDLAPVAQGVVAVVGMGTALMAAIIALSQIDIKRVIAYSTMSQIGLMIYAVGIGAYTAGMFHFATHAVFKALLFMAAGNVIHALHDEQDIRLMGGLARTMRTTERCFLSGTLALAGVPFFAGFFSKEGILGAGFDHGPGGAAHLLYLVGIGINILTGLYAFRLWATVFRGEPQTARSYAAHEPRWAMMLPVVILAVLSAAVGLVQWPVSVFGWRPGVVSNFLAALVTLPQQNAPLEPTSAFTEWTTLIMGTACSMLGVGLAIRWWYQRQPDPAIIVDRVPTILTQLSLHKFYFDELYDTVLVRPTTALARGVRRVVEPVVMDGWVRNIASTLDDFSEWVRNDFQTGLVRDYASVMLTAIVVGGVFAVLVSVLSTTGHGP